MLPSTRCRPQSGVGDGLGTGVPGAETIPSTCAPPVREQRPVNAPRRSGWPASTSACTAQTAARVGKLTRQGSPQLRWALYEAALAACRPSSPDHADDQALKDRGLSHTRASLTIARKLARRSYHVLRELGPAALDPIATN